MGIDGVDEVDGVDGAYGVDGVDKVDGVNGADLLHLHHLPHSAHLTHLPHLSLLPQPTHPPHIIYTIYTCTHTHIHTYIHTPPTSHTHARKRICHQGDLKAMQSHIFINIYTVYIYVIVCKWSYTQYTSHGKQHDPNQCNVRLNTSMYLYTYDFACMHVYLTPPPPEMFPQRWTFGTTLSRP